MFESQRLNGDCANAIHREIFRKLASDFRPDDLRSEQAILTLIAERAHLLHAIVESWASLIARSESTTDTQLTDGLGFDFYSDDMLGYHVCENLSHLYSILIDNQIVTVDDSYISDNQSLHDRVYDDLVEYIQLQWSYNGLGDITKRTYGAIATLCLYSDSIRARFQSSASNSLHENSGEWDWRSLVQEILDGNS